MKKLLTSILLLLFSSLALLAQETTVKGNLAGTVFDSSGALVVNAKISLTGPIGNKTTSTDSDGRFTFSLLAPGFYSVKAEQSGFKATQVSQVEVLTDRTAIIRLTLEAGGSTEVVEVVGSSSGVDTTSTKLEVSLNDTFYSQLPVARNVTGLFYASAGVTDGGGTGAANPSIAGGSGLENQYVADGVNITDGAFGGIGVYSRDYGPLATGINLSFVKEVDVKTGGYEPQYGKSTGGVIQIVTKSGGNAYHGGAAFFYAPQQFEAQRKDPDNFGLFNQYGYAAHQGARDVSGELGGYIPGMKDHLFFFGSFNPSYNAYYDQFAAIHGVTGVPTLPNATVGQTSYDYAGKLTWKLNDKHQIESSVFGDPTHEGSFEPNFSLATQSKTTFDKLSDGTRSWVVRYNATVSPTWLFNASFSWGHNYLNDTPASPGTYGIADYTGRTVGASTSPIGPDGTPLTGIYELQGLGYYENTVGDNYSLTFDTEKVVNKLGSHTLSVGYHYERNGYAGVKLYSGPGFPVTAAMAAASGLPAGDVGLIDTADFQLRRHAGSGVFADVPGFGLAEVSLLQTRGEFDNPNFNTHGRYHAAYVNDAWSIGRHVTVNAGYRWEEQRLQGTPYVSPTTAQNTLVHYTFNDNWSPRFGLAIDPLGDRKTKIYGNFARYSYAIPLDMAIRSLSNEEDLYDSYWAPPETGPFDGVHPNLAANSDGTLAPLVLNDATLLGPLASSTSSGEFIAHNTKMEYLQEWVYGASHEFKHGIVVDIRWQDRRLKRIVEDMSGISPEAFQAGVPQQYLIANPSPKLDLYTNPIQIDYPTGSAVPAGCPNTDLQGGNGPVLIDPVLDSDGNVVPPGAMCIANPGTSATGWIAGAPKPDGKPDGFVSPVRVYKGLEFEISKSFSKGWQWRTNYRWAELYGNYEGAFRNDNNQSDPSISSLFDFVAGDFNLLGDQFGVGPLNTDRRHTINNFISYAFATGPLRNLTLGGSARIQTGTPISDLAAHPAYLNAGEIPIGGRGSLGRTNSFGEGDLHAEYLVRVGERQSIHFGADLFNVANQKTQLSVNQDRDRSYGVPNVDFLKPYGLANGNIGQQLTFQRPFYGRLFAKWEF